MASKDSPLSSFSLQVVTRRESNVQPVSLSGPKHKYNKITIIPKFSFEPCRLPRSSWSKAYRRLPAVQSAFQCPLCERRSFWSEIEEIHHIRRFLGYWCKQALRENENVWSIWIAREKWYWPCVNSIYFRTQHSPKQYYSLTSQRPHPFTRLFLLIFKIACYLVRWRAR